MRLQCVPASIDDAELDLLAIAAFLVVCFIKNSRFMLITNICQL